MNNLEFICNLSKNTQIKIKNRIKYFLKKEGYVGEEASEILENAMSGRLCDLEDCINIKNL